MILHHCIKCKYIEIIPLSDGQLPKIQKYICPNCKKIQWIKHSRLLSETYSNNEIIINKKINTIKLK